MMQTNFAKQSNIYRRCGNCLYWFRENEDMLPDEDKHKIPGICNNEHILSYRGYRLPHNGLNCSGFKREKTNDAD